MAIILRLDRVMADRKMSLNELSKEVGISNVNLSNLKTGKVKAIRFSTLESICDVLPAGRHIGVSSGNLKSGVRMCFGTFFF